MKFSSDPINLRQVRLESESFAKAAGFREDCCQAIGLVINEALANVIRHGYKGATDRPIELTLQRDADELTISIRDWSPPFDPATLPRKPRGSTTPGGLGLICMHELMDDVHWERLADGMLLRMKRRIA